MRDLHRGLRRHLKVFTGKEAVGVLVESGVAKDITDALAIGNAFLRKFRILSVVRYQDLVDGFVRYDSFYRVRGGSPMCGSS